MRKIISLQVRPEIKWTPTHITKILTQKAKWGKKLKLNWYKKTKDYNETKSNIRPLSCPPKVKKTLDKLIKHRRKIIADLPRYYNSANWIKHQVPSKEFPRLSAILCGGSTDNVSKIDLEISAILKKHTIMFVGHQRNKQPGKNQVLFEGYLGEWTQDYLEIGTRIKIPFIHPEIILSEERLTESILTDRTTTRGDLYKSGYEVDYMGQVSNEHQFSDAISFAHSLGVKARLMLTFNEGGNTLIGTKPSGGHYVIIGKDSKELSRFLICEEKKQVTQTLSATVSDEELKMAYAIDYGVKAEDVFFVEQPGNFHLDMAMTIVGPKTIIMNDSVAALQFYRDYFETVTLEGKSLTTQSRKKLKKEFESTFEMMMKKAIIRKKFEDAAQEELEKNGFKIKRIGGNFQDPIDGERMNFFNMVQATTPRGSKLIIAGGFRDPFFQKKFETLFKELGIKVDHFEYISYSETMESLATHGGLACRCKGIAQSEMLVRKKK